MAENTDNIERSESQGASGPQRNERNEGQGAPERTERTERNERNEGLNAPEHTETPSSPDAPERAGDQPRTGIPEASSEVAPRLNEPPAVKHEDYLRASGPQLGEHYDLADLDIQIPALRVKRAKGGGRRDLSDDVRPSFKRGAKPVDGLVRGRDYELSFADAFGTPLTEVKDDGFYQAIIHGTSPQLSGVRTVTFDVKKSRKWLAALLAFLVVALVVTGIVLTQCRSWYDPNAGDGLAGLSDTDIQAILDAKVEEGMMNITILTPIFFPDGSTQPGEAGFNNIEANHVDQKLTITLADSGEVVYESGAIAPGQNIHYITLNRDLSPGNYAAIAAVTGYDPDSHEETGTMNAEVILSVS